jgi:DNA polymerase-1
VGKILQYRELAKLKNTYLDSLPALVDKESRLHTTYAPDTQTGRISSRNPNLQNIPIRTDMGKRIRQAFIAPLGFVLVSADYSQIELRIIAHLSGEPKLISAFKAGLDIHEFVSQALGVSRRVAKVINFGVIYGMSAFGLSQTLNISHEEAQNYIDKFFAEYPVLSKYLSNILEKARKGSLKTVFGREREFPGINSPIASIRGQVERMAINYPFQGSGADIIKLAMIKIYPKIKSLNAHLILTVHDELVFEVPETQQEKAYYLIKTTMENVVKLKVPLVVKISVGKNWGEMKEMVL